MKKLFGEIRHDAPASVVVFFVAVPLCLGIALASGAPLFSGLVAGIIGGIVVGSLSASPLGVSGPAAGLAVIVFAAIQDLGFSAFLVAVVLAGVIQITLGACRAGMIAYFFPSAVIKGMLAGIGIIIILKQIPHALGYDRDPEGDLAFFQPDGETTLSAFGSAFASLEPSALFVSSIALVLLLAWETPSIREKKLLGLVPGPLVAVGFGILFQAISSWIAPSAALEPRHLVSVPVAEQWSDLVQMLTFPDWTQLSNPAIYITAATLAIVASLETLLCVDATDRLDPQRRITPANRELLAQGCGNMISGLIGGLPITQVIVRSSANIQSGGRTKLSAILHGVLLLLSVVLLPTLLNLVPLAVLASILFVVGYKLAKPDLMKEMYSRGMGQFAPFAVTILGIVFTDLLTGIGLGMAVAIVITLHRSYMNSHFLHMSEKTLEDDRHVVSIQLAEEVTFLNKGAIIRALSELQNGVHVRIDSSSSTFVDPDVLEAISDFEESAPARQITVERIDRAPDAGPNEGRGVGRANADDKGPGIDGPSARLGAPSPS